MKKTKLHVTSLILATVFIATFGVTVASPFLPKVNAAAFSWTEQTSKTKSYSAVIGLIACFANNEKAAKANAGVDDRFTYTTSTNLNDIVSKWPQGVLGGNDVVGTGFTLNDEGNHDGRAYCNQLAFGTLAQNALGYSGDDIGFLKALGFVHDDKYNYWIFTDGGTNVNLPPDHTNDRIIARIKTLAGSAGVPLSTTTLMQYVLLRDAFQFDGGQGCKAKVTPWAELTTQDQYLKGDPQLRKMKLIDETDGIAKDYGVNIQNIGGSPTVMPDQTGNTTSIGCSDIATQLNDLAPNAATAVAGETAVKNAEAEKEAQKAAAAVYAATICKNVSSGPIGSEDTPNSPKYLCAAAVLKCLQPQTKDLKINGKVVETITINATPEEIDPDTFAQCIVDAKVTNLKQGDIVKIVKKLKKEADAAAAAAREGALQDICTTDPTADGCTDVETSDGCPMQQDTFMRWLGCGLMEAGSGIINFLYNSIKGLLYTPTDQIFTQQFKDVVGKFRIIGMGLILITGLIMVIAQATGSDLVDAYTVRKVLPRLGVAIVGMALAWPLLNLAIGLTNDLGLLAGSFISNLGSGSLGGSEANVAGSSVIWGLGLPITAFVAAMKFGWAGFSLFGTAGLALLVGLLVLAIRQLIVIVLILLAPLAIAASVLPGTDKLWKFWKNSLITTLAMFPLIMLFLKSGEFFARVAGNMQGDANFNSDGWAAIAIIAYFAPYFMLPFAFKMAGGLMGNIFGIVNDRGKGMFDRLRNRRAEAWKDRKARASSNRLWDPNSKVQQALHGNALASWMTSPGSNFAYYNRKRIPFLKRYGEGVASSINAKSVQDSGKLAQKLAQDHGYNDRAFRVLTGSHSELSEGVQQELKAAGLYGKRVQTVEQLKTVSDILARSKGDGSSGIGERNASQAIRSSIGTITNAFHDPEMMKADVAAAGIIGLASAGYANGEDVASAANLIAGPDKSNAEMAQAVLTQAVNVGARGHPELRAGYGPVWDSRENKFVDAMQDANRAADLALKLGMHDIADAKPDAFAAIAKGITQNLAGEDQYKKQEQIDKLFSWAGPYSSAKGDFKAEVLRYIDKDPILKERFAKYSPAAPETVNAAAQAGQEEAANKAQQAGEKH